MAYNINSINMSGYLVAKNEEGFMIASGTTDSPSYYECVYAPWFREENRLDMVRNGELVFVSGTLHGDGSAPMVKKTNSGSSLAVLKIIASRVTLIPGAQVTIVGNLGSNPETRTVGNSSVTNATVAVNNYHGKNDDGTNNTTVTWFKIAFWGKAGESFGNYCTKGDSVTVTGYIGTIKPYTNKQGEEVASIELTVTDLVRHDRNRSGSHVATGNDTDAIPF
jgi:single-strand DNA-binding protein